MVKPGNEAKDWTGGNLVPVLKPSLVGKESRDSVSLPRKQLVGLEPTISHTAVDCFNPLPTNDAYMRHELP